MILRAGTVDDAVALAKLGRDSFDAKFGHMYRPEDSAAFLSEQHSTEVVAGQLVDPLYRVMLATRDGALAGYCKLVLACGWPEHARGARAIELKQLYTAPGATGGGIGAALMDWALAEARGFGADEVQLSVWSGNTGAQRFYERYGFAKAADIHFWVGKQRDEEFLFARMI
ncbi:GNAT family N-acetyltransferase [Novosphingobium sp. Gsoil 351]|nr:GNAT family N-acetyltransferase [Novosphingobium sp. Gsoil 351]